jgi:methionine synthase II (cobalamin-independent)
VHASDLQAAGGAIVVTPVELPYGLPALIGSLPFTDPAEAAAFTLERHPRLACAPTLPARSPLEGMLAQAAWGLRGVAVLADGSLSVDPAALDPSDPFESRDLDGEPFVGFRAFLGAAAGRRAPIKLQVTGPLTLGMALRAGGADVCTAFAVAGAAVRARACDMLDATRDLSPGSRLVMFVDEPALVSAMDQDFPLAPNATIDLVSSALAAIEPHGITGLHCCGPADWKLVLQGGPQILSLPVGAGAAEQASAIAPFLERGGWIAWGAVPTDGPLGAGSDRLWRRLSAEWRDLSRGGCDPVLLREQALVTPACGLGLHGEEQAKLVVELTNQVARRLETQTLGMRLTVGA